MAAVRSLVLSAVAVSTALTLSACSSSSSSGGDNPTVTTSTSSSASTTGAGLCGGQKGSGAVTVAAFNFSESELLATIYAQALDKCGFTATVKQSTSREVVYPALVSGQFQVVPEYAATLTDFINTKNNGANAPSKASGDINATLSALQGELPSSLQALQPAAATDKNAFAVLKSFATANSITTLSQLATYSQSHPVTLGGPAECPTRPFCQPGLQKTYGFKFSGFKALDAGGPLTEAAIKKGTVTMGLVFTSDPTVEQNGLVVLNDDKNLQASDNIVPVVSSSLAKSQPALAAALNAVDSKLDENALIQLNQAAGQHISLVTIAQGFLTQTGLSY